MNYSPKLLPSALYAILVVSMFIVACLSPVAADESGNTIETPPDLVSPSITESPTPAPSEIPTISPTVEVPKSPTVTTTIAPEPTINETVEAGLPIPAPMETPTSEPPLMEDPRLATLFNETPPLPAVNTTQEASHYNPSFHCTECHGHNPGIRARSPSSCSGGSRHHRNGNRPCCEHVLGQFRPDLLL